MLNYVNLFQKLLVTIQFEGIEKKKILPFRQGFQPNRTKMVFGLFNAIDRLIV
jgi:hypothetical protein